MLRNVTHPAKFCAGARFGDRVVCRQIVTFVRCPFSLA